MAKLRAAIVTPSEQVVRSDVDMVVAPSVDGEVAILSTHKPLVALLKEGRVEFRDGDKIAKFAVSGGFLEVKDDQITILAETAERAEDIDAARAQNSLTEAQALVKSLDPLSDEYAQNVSRVARAEVRLSVSAH